MTLDVLVEDDRWAPHADALARAFDATLAHLGLPGLEAACLACDDARIAALNADFRGRPAPTNVLSWPSAERGAQDDGGPPTPPRDVEIGDMAIAWDTCAREAAEQGKPMAHHAMHLIVHSALHLLGHDHARPRDAARMEGLEVAILDRLGLPDPYGDRAEPRPATPDRP
ncbi:MAG: rRNA maturation RNase YbeY [Paracoccaceae bacterium]